MEASFDSMKESENLIQRLMVNIQEATENMSNTFEDTVLRHEDQFIKCYKIKIQELVKLLEELKGTIEDKFINNTLAMKLETIIKERDYFKYECLKLNSQHQSLLDDHKSLNAQASNTSQQNTIYKHLLENEKIKSSQIEKNVQKMKKNLSEIVIKSIPEARNPFENKIPEFQKEMVKLRRQIRQKTEAIRALRQKVQDLEKIATLSNVERIEKKEMYELWRICVEGWRRENQAKGKKESSKLLNLEQMSITSKKELLKMFFTHGQFLKFLEQLIFDEGFKVTLQSTEENFMERNRAKLLNYMNQRRVYSNHRGIRM